MIRGLQAEANLANMVRPRVWAYDLDEREGGIVLEISDGNADAVAALTIMFNESSPAWLRRAARYLTKRQERPDRWAWDRWRYEWKWEPDPRP